MQYKIIYGVFVLKRDQDSIQVLETESFEEADKLWIDLKNKWTTCIKEQVPFELRKPIVTAFDPGLIYEITIRPQTENVQTNNNPYYQKAQREGFSSVLRGGDVLDGGYK